MVTPEKQGKAVLFTLEDKCRGRKRKKWNDDEEEKNMKVEGNGRQMQKRDSKRNKQCVASDYFV